MRSTPFFVLSTVLVLASRSAAAQTDTERATARDAANAGLAAYEAGRYDAAIDSFTRAEQLVHAPTHVLFLARSQAHAGKLVAAHESYLKVVREHLAPGAPGAFVDAQAAAERERGPLDARVPSITITIQGTAPGDLSVLLDGNRLPPAMVGIPLPLDPGPHVFKAIGSGIESAPVTNALAEGSKQTVLLTLSASAARPANASLVSTSTSSATPELGDRAPGAGHPLRSGAFVGFGVGAVGIGLGTYFLLKSSATRSDSDGLFRACTSASSNHSCANSSKQAAINAKDDDADTQRNLGVASLIVGGLGAATGVALFVLDSARHPAPAHSSSPRIVPMVGFRSLGLLGTF